MNHNTISRHVNAIAGRLSLRAPQKESLRILDHVTQLVPPHRENGMELQEALQSIHAEYPTVTHFEREFPSLCFSLATGVGKTRLMGAFITYLHLEHGLNNFFVLSPNLTIYNKLITDFTPNTSKYVFKGISEFVTNSPRIVTGENFEQAVGTLFDAQFLCNINIFNISKLNSEMRGGKMSRIKRLQEYIGESYFDYLAKLPDLVLLMDESHRYRGTAGVRILNELNPVLGLELTATPWIETNRGPEGFRNIIYGYPLGRAMQDGFVKEPAVVTRYDFDSSLLNAEELEDIKLQDGIRLHELVKIELENYANQTGKSKVKPILLIIARDITHAATLMEYINSDIFLGGRYIGKVIQVDSSKTGAEEELMIQRLLDVESSTDNTEIVIHVNMLKEGWDVTNLYTIVPLRAARAKVLVEQSIGRGLRLPYGTRTGIAAVDRLSIIAHDRFIEIIEEANRPDSIIKLQQVYLDDPSREPTPIARISPSNIETVLGLNDPIYTSQTDSEINPDLEGNSKIKGGINNSSLPFNTEMGRQVAQTTYRAINILSRERNLLPTTASLSQPQVQAQLVAEVTSLLPPTQLELEGMGQATVAEIIFETAKFVAENCIDIPRILVVPREQTRFRFEHFIPDLNSLRLTPPSNEMYLQYLRSGEYETIKLINNVIEKRLEDYIVAALIDHNDIAYDEHADLLYSLASQTIEHFLNFLSPEETQRTVVYFKRQIGDHLYNQMRAHLVQEPIEYDVEVSQGFTTLKATAYTTIVDQSPLDFRQVPPDRNSMAKYVFGGFSRCLYPLQKFDSDPERKLAIILDRDSQKWFRPARGQFQLFYRVNTEPQEYQPDFVAETLDNIFLIECKRRNEIGTDEVKAKGKAAVQWCQYASDYTASHGGKPWNYLLVPHDAIAENMSLVGLSRGFKLIED